MAIASVMVICVYVWISLVSVVSGVYQICTVPLTKTKTSWSRVYGLRLPSALLGNVSTKVGKRKEVTCNVVLFLPFLFI